MPDLDGVREAVTGGAVARAVEPDAGEAREGHTNERNCLNCGCELVGSYCHCCGQRGHVHRTIAAWWHDFLHSVLHLDGKFWRTLPMLAWKPGELTRRYAHGERAKFISPLALFLFTVFLMFAVFSISGGSIANVDQGQIAAEIAADLEDDRRQVSELEQERKQAEATGRATDELDRRISSLREDIAGRETAANIAGGRPIVDTDVHTGWETLDKGIAKANENPSLLLYKLQANAYKFSWALIPISVPFVWILFLHRKRYRREFTGYDHLVFVTYSIAFMSLALIALVLVRAIGAGSGLLNLAFLLIPPLHIYRQLRGAYGLSSFSAAWRAFVLLICASVALTLFLMLLLAIGVLG